MFRKKRRRKIFTNKGAVIDKGAIYVVVILTLLIFGAYIMVGGTLPTKLPKVNTRLISVNAPAAEPTTAGLQLRTFYGATTTPHPTQLPLPTTSPNQPILVECNSQITGTQEVEMLWAYSLEATPASGNQIALKAFYTNKYALLLGSGAVSAMKQHPADHIANPALGDTTVKDIDNFPLFPAVFLTDITTVPADTSGDAKNGGRPNNPSDVYGTWKAAGAQDPAQNNANLGQGADTWPPANGPGAGVHDSEFTAEIIWKLSNIQAIDPTTKLYAPIQPGHRYRAQIVLHDGGNPRDVGVACLNFLAPNI